MRLPRHILPYGSDALLVTWEQRIAPDISEGVHAYAAELKAQHAGLECIPAYALLLVRFAMPKISPYRLRAFNCELRDQRSETPKPILNDLT